MKREKKRNGRKRKLLLRSKDGDAGMDGFPSLQIRQKEGDAPDIVRDSITKVTFFDYSDILGGDTEESEEE